MALIFPTSGSGEVDFSSFPVASSADFGFEFDQIIMPNPVGSLQVILGNNTSSGSFISASSGRLRVRIATGQELQSEVFPAGQVFTNVVLSRVSNVVTLSSDQFTDVVLPSGGFGAFTYDVYGSGNGGSFQFTGAIAGEVRFYNSVGALSTTHNFDQALGATTLPDTTGSRAGTLAGFAQSGSGFDGDVLNSPPVVDAGADDTATSGVAYQLAATVTDADVGDTLTYAWTQSVGDTGTFSNAAIEDPTFTPAAGSHTKTLTLSVSDGTATVTDDVVLTVGLGSPTISITTPATNDRVKQRNTTTNQADFTFSGDITSLPVGAIVQYSFDNTNWSTLDGSPTTTYSGVVTVTSTQTVYIRLLDGATPYAGGNALCIAGAIVIGDGQSNMEGRIDNNQVVTLEAGAKQPYKIIESTKIPEVLTDPTGRPAQNPISEGSLGPLIISKLANANKEVTYVFLNLADGGTSIASHLKGTTNYTRTIGFANRVGGSFEINLLLIGESDAGTFNRDEAYYITNYGAYINDMKADFGCDTYLIGIPKANYTGDAALRSGFASLVANNVNCKDGGDLRPLDLANTGGDGTHITTDAQGAQTADIIWAADLGLDFGDNPVNTAPSVEITGPVNPVNAGANAVLNSVFTDATPDQQVRTWRVVTPNDGSVVLSSTSGASVNFNAPSLEVASTVRIGCIPFDGTASGPEVFFDVDVLPTADIIAPIILVSGNLVTNLIVGEPIPEFTFSASDNRDGDLTGAVDETGDTIVNTAPGGTYIRRFNVEDAAGNQANEVTRTVVYTEAIVTSELTVDMSAPEGGIPLTAGTHNFDFHYEESQVLIIAKKPVTIGANGIGVTTLNVVAGNSVDYSLKTATEFSGGTGVTV